MSPRLTAADVTVVIPSFARAVLLQDTLDSLGAAHGAEALDVVVIDDGSVPPLTPSSAQLPFPLRVLRQASAGLNTARNAGAEASDREIIAFLDDDVLVGAGWPQAIAAAFDPPEVAVAAGRVRARPEVPLPGWIHPHKLMYLSVLDLGGEPAPIPVWASPVGANLAVRRAALLAAGGFRDGLDRRGASLLSGGDTELVRRIVAAGGTVLYAPEAVVEHRIAADRLTRSWFRRRAEAQGASDILIAHTRRPGPKRLALELVRPARAIAIAAKRLAARESVIDAELWLWSCRGRLRAVGRLPR